MTDHSPDETTPSRQSVRDASAMVLAAGGIAAAFGAASCCALPMLLGSVGLGSAWLIAVAWLAVPPPCVRWARALPVRRSPPSSSANWRSGWR